jgi:hypothetical protein
VKASFASIVVVVIALLTAAAPAAAQRPRFGPHLGYNFDVEDPLLGAQLSWPVTPRLDLYPSFDYYFVDPGSLWSLNFDLKLRPPARTRFLYLGAGLNYSRASVGGFGNSDTGLNLLVGLEGRRSRSAPYVEAKLIVGDGSSLQIVGGFSTR